MNIHEYQAKKLLEKYGVSVPKGIAAMNVQEAVMAAKELENNGTTLFVLKAQIHAGGRGAGYFKGSADDKGGVRLCKNVDEVRIAAEAMMDNILVTKQTGAEGKKVQRLYVTNGVDIDKEYYVSVLLDRATSKVTFIISTEGGMDIEEVAEKTPEKIIKVSIDPIIGVTNANTEKLADVLGLKGAVKASAMDMFACLYKAYMELDASIIEINPLITVENKVMALDAKMNFDPNALFRHPEIAALRDESEEDVNEKIATDNELSYVRLDGDIGCMVNGAGLAMATMDIIKLYGGEPANFLDVGGSATSERVTVAFKIILSDPNVKSVLVNIFGGIMKCDIIAEGIVAAAKEILLDIPLVVRLEGTNVKEGKKIIADSGLSIITANDLDDAARKIVTATQKSAVK
ncbi:MAG: ADP-forming succinate--CoA ligase subunit beta [Alphaproteobacteria bacterium]|nr:ADP-forming succinate--CoA ligase subunit beta [Alphaproteobacteria bacterium]